MNASNIIYQKEVPYFLTILFIVLGWILVHIATRLISAPIIEYDVCKSHEGKLTKYSYVFTNISRNNLYRNLTFDIVLNNTKSSKSKIDSSYPIIHPPLLRQVKRVGSGDEYASFKVTELNPLWKVEFIVKVKGNLEPSIHLSTGEKGLTPVRLIEASIITFLVKYELWV